MFSILEESAPRWEDVLMLMSLPLFSEAHAIRVTLSGDDQKRVEFLSKPLSSSKYLIIKAIYLSWVKFLDEGEERNRHFKIEFVLAYWLLYFIFSSPLEDGLHIYIIFFVVLSAKGSRLALAPLHLGFLYVRLDEHSWSFFRSISQYDVLSYVNESFLQMFLGEDWSTLPHVVDFKDIKPEKVVING